MADRRAAPARFALFALLLVVGAVAGFMLGACGGDDGSALTTRTDLTTTRPALTATQPAESVEPTVPNRTVPTLPTRTATSPATTVETTTAITTSAIPTTAPGQTTPAPAPTVTVTEPATTIVVTEPPTTTEAPTAPATTETGPTPTTSPKTTAVAAEPTSSTSSTPWGWIVVGVALAAALVIGIAIWRRRRVGAAAWSTQLADLTRRCLVALDDVVAEGSVVTGRIQALAAEAQSLKARAPDDPSRTAAARLRAGLEGLAVTLESDRTLRLGSPPPSTEQISYSTALIRQQVEQLQGVLRPPPTGQPRA